MNNKVFTWFLCLSSISALYAQTPEDLKLFDLQGPVKEVTYDGSFLLQYCFLDDLDIQETFMFDRNGRWDEELPDLFYGGKVEREDGKIVSIYSSEIEIEYDWDIDDDLRTIKIEFDSDSFIDFYTEVKYNYIPFGDGYMVGGTFNASRRDDSIQYRMTTLKYSDIDSNGNWTKCIIYISTPDENGKYETSTATVSRKISYYQASRDYSWLYGTWTSPVGNFMTDHKEGSIYIDRNFLLESDSKFEYQELYYSSKKKYNFSGDYIFVDGKKKYSISFSKKTISSLDGKVVMTKMKNQEPPLSISL